MTRDTISGRAWVNERVSRSGDEFNLIVGGNNYGWSKVTYSNEYWGPRVSDETSLPGIADAGLVWVPATAPSGLAYYTGDVYPQWKGNLFSGALQLREVMSHHSGRHPVGGWGETVHRPVCAGCPARPRG
jgi:glucose/arabinose dehydrogenase